MKKKVRKKREESFLPLNGGKALKIIKLLSFRGSFSAVFFQEKTSKRETRHYPLSSFLLETTRKRRTCLFRFFLFYFIIFFLFLGLAKKRKNVAADFFMFSSPRCATIGPPSKTLFGFI